MIRKIRKFCLLIVAVSLFVAVMSPAVHAELERVGPTLTNFGYPAWYQDKTGLVLEFCSPLNQAELAGGWCLLLPPGVFAPEVFPNQFFDEHFYWSGSAGPITFPLPGGGTSKAILVLALEGAFAVGPVVAGDQIAFGRIRIRVNDLPFDGDYTVYHPYGTRVFRDQVAGTRLFFTEDIGITCPPGDFTCALASNIGPFLLPSNTPGGAELPPVGPTTSGLTTPYPGTGKLYIADPGRSGAATGSPVGQNFFRVVGPTNPATGQPWVIETSNFSLMGRVMSDVIPGRVTIDRASYTAGATANKLDVFATAFPTVQGRVPGALMPPAITPLISFFDAPCSGPLDANGNIIPPYSEPALFTAEVQMNAAGSNYWGQAAPAIIPAKVCVEDHTARNAAGQVVPVFYQGTVTDEVTITQASYDPSTGGTLSVIAASSDGVNSPSLTLSWPGMPISSVTGTGGQFSVAPLAAPPAKVRVVSSAGGITEYSVTTGVSTAPSQIIPVALDDYAATLEDTPVTINPLVNDTLNGGPIPAGAVVTITQAPRIGTTGPINPDGSFLFTPNQNVNGNEGIGYTVTVNGVTSNQAYITIAITPVNDPPVAVNDSTSVVAGTPATVNVTANDIDVDGDILSAVNVVPSAGLTVNSVSGGLVTVTAAAPGIYTFTYQVRDNGVPPLTSLNTATATVSVSASEVITVTLAEYRTSAARFRVSGTDSVHAGQTITIRYNNGSNTTTVLATAVVDAAGAWAVDIRPATGILDPRTTGATRIRVTSSLSAAFATANINIRQ